MSVMVRDNSTGDLHVFCKVGFSSLQPCVSCKANGVIMTSSACLAHFHDESPNDSCDQASAHWHGQLLAEYQSASEATVCRVYQQHALCLRDYQQSGVTWLYFVQGSFEQVGEIASQQSVPSEYLQTAQQYASEGCYVLAMAHRSVT